ncbi:chitobiosyldiphosphodolichol beta-mannosyltransferase [Trichogramma pretiosum]|uniref:chitobiosyldiphosphodolichol beta-mannosyltransferase n=1 Tax=Trichogramma pretiosum TaxID=7493 RepID=UPI0006C9D0F3|nr:chitobiosyldiphosphodolichol beta-mannosyltransferase [Trichogramma pretiosum]
MELFVHFFGLSFVFGIMLSFWYKIRQKTKKICIVILGDIGRSPRMQYHAASFLKEGYEVEIVGYHDTKLIDELQGNAKLKVHRLSSPPKLDEYVTKALWFGIKIVWQSLDLLYALFFKCDSSFLLLQNPPAVPTIPICWFYCLIKKIEFTIDWHNYAHTIMAISLSNTHPLVRLAKYLEMYYGTKATNHFCVTKAMQEDLSKNYNIKAKVLYDRPAEKFRSISLSEKHELLMRLMKTQEDCDAFKSNDENSTALTKEVDGDIILQNERPAMIVSSTSWTPDEDFSTLIKALCNYDKLCKETNSPYPNLICVITGKGELKQFYRQVIKNENLKHVKVLMPWLQDSDYPKLLASADLGISLHTSSSGLDLPMKIVDMFGCGLPVCAINFPCLSELVRDNENSLVFTNSEELTEHFKTWFRNFPNDPQQQKLCSQFKNELHKFQDCRWHENWTSVALPCFTPSTQ